MIIVTGAAGFIGSALVWGLNGRGVDDVMAVDELRTDAKWKNLAGLKIADYLEKDDFLARLEAGKFDAPEAILHMGACSDTTETDASFLAKNNFDYTRRLAEYAAAGGVRFIYASSAATYGDGSAGYDDDESEIDALRPLNMYAMSKQMFDQWALRAGLLGKIAGLKYFNVFGPNEYHKGEMRSMVNKGWEQAKSAGRIRLFRSTHPDYPDGGQKRDFLYVKDALKMTLFFLDHPDVNGVYNAGSGKASTWNELAAAVFGALDMEPRIEYIDMPDELRGKYQNYTKAEMGRLAAAFEKAGEGELPVSPLGGAVSDYVRNYLEPGRYLGSAE